MYRPGGKDRPVAAGVTEEVFFSLPAPFWVISPSVFFTALKSFFFIPASNVPILLTGLIPALKRMSWRTPFPSPGIRCFVARKAFALIPGLSPSKRDRNHDSLNCSESGEGFSFATR
ncbi:MAG: hypothetical protein LBR47_03755 [Spirochaetaceae bacterium]|nr:hypothetical protein [Spirochaetaceae bacterium]